MSPTKGSHVLTLSFLLSFLCWLKHERSKYLRRGERGWDPKKRSLYICHTVQGSYILFLSLRLANYHQCKKKLTPATLLTFDPTLLFLTNLPGTHNLHDPTRTVVKWQWCQKKKKREVRGGARHFEVPKWILLWGCCIFLCVYIHIVYSFPPFFLPSTYHVIQNSHRRNRNPFKPGGIFVKGHLKAKTKRNTVKVPIHHSKRLLYLVETAWSRCNSQKWRTPPRRPDLIFLQAHVLHFHRLVVAAASGVPRGSVALDSGVSPCSSHTVAARVYRRIRVLHTMTLYDSSLIQLWPLVTTKWIRESPGWSSNS